MVELYFGEMTAIDVTMALLTGIAGAIALAIAYKLTENGVERWKPRKVVHVSMGTVIGLTVVGYSNLSGPALATGIFLTVLFYVWAHKSSLLFDLLLAGSRPGESSKSTFAAGFMGMVSFALSFVLFLPRPEIFVAAILSVSWADASGEVFGRYIGRQYVNAGFRNKSVEGSIAVFLFAIISISISLLIYSDCCVLCLLPHIVFVALIVAVTELLSTRWMDNFFIPLVTSFMMWLLLFPSMPLLGIFPVFA
ncbi:hypothetical protein EU538_04575 [Candidatus Thorarchaeota archaeon]|jgi:dolichol kinase|nr:MAG: hypothetical protein EU538_04575 [Candidatus Thorarchaeota archaeon]